MESTKAPSYWTRIWNERDVQIMVLLSLALQLFLLVAGNVRRRCRVGWLRFFVWLAYLASYSVAVSAIGLFSQYEDKYKLRADESSEHLHKLTLPFLWPPFLLFHLGGPDTITSFSPEDNNLWNRQWINLMVQLSLALYVFWKSFDLLDSQLLAIAVPLFVAGIIKYGERIWALQRGSHDAGFSRYGNPISSFLSPPAHSVMESDDGLMESYALKSAILARKFLFAKTVREMDFCDKGALLQAFGKCWPAEKNLKLVLTELGMIYDMLYTKVLVLRSCTGVVLRCITLVAMLFAFVLFWANQHLQGHKSTNSAITYVMFIAAIFLEVYSALMMIASPWTRACSKKGAFLYRISHKLDYCFPSHWLSSQSIGQFNLVHYAEALPNKSMPKFVSKVLQALGLENQWRNFWHVKHVEDKVIAH
jgi:hypothetical protein